MELSQGERTYVFSIWPIWQIPSCYNEPARSRKLHNSFTLWHANIIKTAWQRGRTDVKLYDRRFYNQAQHFRDMEHRLTTLISSQRSKIIKVMKVIRVVLIRFANQYCSYQIIIILLYHILKIKLIKSAFI